MAQCAELISQPQAEWGGLQGSRGEIKAGIGGWAVAPTATQNSEG